MADARVKPTDQLDSIQIYSEKARLVCAGLVFVVSLALYTLTIAPTVTLVDSGELIVAVHNLGVAHPPGFPLYLLLAHIATMLPAGSIALRINFASALFASLAAGMLTLVVLEAIQTNSLISAARGKKKAERGKKAKRKAAASSESANRESHAKTHPVWALVAGAASGLLLAFSRTFWSYATIAEVYTLTVFVILSILLLMLRWRRLKLEETIQVRSGNAETGKSSARHRLLYAAALLFGLALGAHIVTVLLMLPALALLVYSTEGMRFFKSRQLTLAALFSLIGSAIYAYLPVAASRSPILNWGDPRTLERFWWHVSARQYQVNFSLSLEKMVSHAGEFLGLVSREFGPLWLPAGLLLAAFGLFALSKRDKTLFWVLAAIILADLIYALNYEIAEDKDAYYLPVFFSLAFAAGFGTLWLARALSARLWPTALSRGAPAAIVLAALAVSLIANLPFNNRRRYFIAQDYVTNALSTIEPGGLLLTADWQIYSPMLYFREVEGLRHDVISIDVQMLRRSWYFDYLRRVYPELIGKTQGKVDAFLEDLRHWEQDPDLYQRDLFLNNRISSRFKEMILAFISNHIKEAPAYITKDIALGRDAEYGDLAKSLSASYQLVPQGLVFQLFSEFKFHEPAAPHLITRGLADGTLKFDDKDVVSLKVKPVYVEMLVNRGRYLARMGRHEEAIASYEEALALEPGFAGAQQSLSESMNALRNPGNAAPK